MLTDAQRAFIDDTLKYLRRVSRGRPKPRRKRRGHAHRGHVLSPDDRDRGRARANARRSAMLAEADAKVIGRVLEWRAKGMTIRDVASKLGRSTRLGGWWSVSAVHRLLARAASNGPT